MHESDYLYSASHCDPYRNKDVVEVISLIVYWSLSNIFFPSSILLSEITFEKLEFKI